MKDSAPVSSTPSERRNRGKAHKRGEYCVSTCSCETETSVLFSCGMVNTGMLEICVRRGRFQPVKMKSSQC